jgi:large subunit ribosomal protein L4
MEQQTNFEAAAYTARGTPRERVSLPGEVFDGTVNVPVMHQAVKAFLANQRQANAHTKIRKYVTGGNQKPWKQKGTGRARQGSTRAPQWVGGGTVFGPLNERNYTETVPRQVRQLARKSALNARAREGAVLVVDAFTNDAPKTKQMLALLAAAGVDGKKVLVLTDGVKLNVFLSARNIPTAHVMPYTDASTYHILWSDVVVIEAPAIGQTLEPVAESAPAPRVKTPKPELHEKQIKAQARREAKAERSAAEPKRTKAAKKATAKKSVAKKSAATKSTTKSTTKRTTAKKSATKAKPAAKKAAAKKCSAQRAPGSKKKEK